MSARTPPDPVSPELVGLLRRLKLGRCLDTLPERLTLARGQSLPHQDFLMLLLSDEVTRRDQASAELRGRAAGLDPTMRLGGWCFSRLAASGVVRARSGARRTGPGRVEQMCSRRVVRLPRPEDIKIQV